jgi:Spy/CpxP family protein refolding chaperone
MRSQQANGEPPSGLPDRALWQRSRAVETSEDEAERLLDLAGFVDARLDDDERERVAARLALDTDAAADVAAARELAAIAALPAPAAVVMRATALVGGEIIAFRPRHRVAVVWQGAGWGSLAAAIVLASWIGFDLGSTASAAFANMGRGDDVSLSGWSGGFWRRRTLVALLVVSLALNLCFVAGGVWSRLHAPEAQPIGAERFRQLAEELKLTPDQRVAFGKYVAILRLRSERLRQEIEPLLAATWTEVGKEQPDEAQVSRLVEDVSGRRLAYQREVLAQTATLLATFLPEQRAKFVADVIERRGSAQRRHFDATH